MRIAIEAQRIFRTNKHGMDFVALESIRELQKIDKENEYFIFVSPGEDHCLEETDNVHIIEVKCPTYPLWEQVALPRNVSKIKPDLLHCTSNTAPLNCPVPLVLTLHDIIFLEPRQGGNKSWYQNMGWYYRRMVVPRILPQCRKIITVSRFECDRIREALRLPKDKITAIYNGYSEHFHPLPEISSITHKYINNDDYIFFLGNTDPKKNVARTLKAYSLYLKHSEKKRPLLIADLSEDKLDAILREQRIEAMACGTPVITGNTSAMPEIAGEGGILVDPLSEKEIADKILYLERDQIFYQNQIEYGLNRVKRFSWSQTAENLLTLYKTI